jgi:hypothetical protein
VVLGGGGEELKQTQILPDRQRQRQTCRFTWEVIVEEGLRREDDGEVEGGCMGERG